jgi:hypothetical protein
MKIPELAVDNLTSIASSVARVTINLFNEQIKSMTLLISLSVCHLKVLSTPCQALGYTMGIPWALEGHKNKRFLFSPLWALQSCQINTTTTPLMYKATEEKRLQRK